MRVGFIGLGNQGAPIAHRIVRGGFDTVVWGRRAEATAAFRSGPATVAASPAELGQGLDLLETCVFDADGTREILFGDGGAARSMPAGSVIAVHSTVLPAEIKEIAQIAESEYGLHVLDCPVSGGSIRAELGEMVTMVGGEAKFLEVCRPVFSSFSSHIIHLGAVGAGQQAKLLNNALLTANIGVASDALLIGASWGLDRTALAEVLTNGSGRSYAVEMVHGSGNLRAISAGQARPTLAKDVRLLAEAIRGSGLGESLLGVAEHVIEELDALANEQTG